MPVIKLAKSCTDGLAGMVMVAGLALAGAPTASADWSIDFSRRNLKSRESDLNAASRPERQPASAQGANYAPAGESGREGSSGSSPVVIDTTAKALPAKKGVLDTVFDAGEPIQDVVIILTDKGFIPSTLRVRKGGRYKVHVANVNEKEKNVSFILDGFSEHHAIYYGKIKIFVLEPRKEGSYSFQSPETSSEGKLIVFNPQVSVRSPASEE